MPSIVLVERLKGIDYQQVELVRLYKQLFRVSLKEAAEHVDFMSTRDGYEILIAEADVKAAADFVYQARQFGMTCRLQSDFIT
jgi:hypothetical protein